MTANGGSEDDAQKPGMGTSTSSRVWETTARPSVEVVEAVAAATARDPLEMPQLNDYVDPDALDKLLGAAAEKSTDPAHVSFDYDGVRVTVDSTGAVTVEE